MTIGRLIEWLGDLTGGSVPAELRSERVMRVDSILRASIILNTRACTLVRLHDIEGYTLSRLQTVTGLPASTLQRRLAETRQRLSEMLH